MNTQVLAVLIIIGLVIGAGGGYYVGSLPIKDLQATITNQNQQISTLQNNNNALTSQISVLQTQNAALTSQNADLKIELDSMTLVVNDKYNASILDGVYILSYEIKSTIIGGSQVFTADFTIYNSLTTADVTVKFYGTAQKEFTYTVTTGQTLHRVEVWTGGIFTVKYNGVLVESVKR